MHEAKPDERTLITDFRAVLSGTSVPQQPMVGHCDFDDDDWDGTHEFDGARASKAPSSAIRSSLDPTEVAVGDWLSAASKQRAEKAHGSRQLVQELSVLGAPRTLVQRTRMVLRDAVHHARLMAALSEEFATAVELPRATVITVRGLFPLALDNAHRGCARETLAASVGLIQAGRATDLRIARAMRRIAHDELRQAQLSWDLHQWCLSQLDTEDAKKVEEALDRTIDELSRLPLENGLTSACRLVLGLPMPAELSELSRQTMENLKRGRRVA